MMTPTKPPPPPAKALWPIIKNPAGQSGSWADAMDMSQEAFERECNPENPQEDEWTSVHGAFTDADMARRAEELSWPVGADQESDGTPVSKEPKGKVFTDKGMVSGKPTDKILTSWPDADAAASAGDPAPTEDFLLDDHVDEEFLQAIPNLAAGRCSLAIPKAMAMQ
eukprot:8977528-Karenia_brevis.AAC.1